MSFLNEAVTLATHGFNAPDLGLALVRGSVGVFFGISGYHKLFNKERHARLSRTMVNNRIPFPKFNEWWVPGWEFVAGGMLTLGLFSSFSAIVLMIICIVAACCEAPEKVKKYNPIDVADVIDDYLYLPEVLYILMLAATILVGPGSYSLDALFF